MSNPSLEPGALSKFRDGETVQDYRRKQKTTRKTKVLGVKTQLRIRDGQGCRWPGCEFWKLGYRVEGIHLDDMGMGGDKKLLRTQRHRMLRLCIRHHQGPLSVHSKHLDVVPVIEARGTDGPCTFLMRKTLDHPWETVGIEDEFTLAKLLNPAAEEQADDDDAEDEG